MTMRTFEEVMDAGKNISLEMQRRYGVQVQITSHEVVPQNFLQKLFSKPKVRVQGCITDPVLMQNSANNARKSASDNTALLEEASNNRRVEAAVDLFAREEKNVLAQDGLFTKDSCKGLLHACQILRENEFSNEFLSNFIDYVTKNLTLHELRDIPTMEKILDTVFEKEIMFYQPRVGAARGEVKGDSESPQRIITLVGPTGTGKTTAISKIAVELFRERDGRGANKNTAEKNTAPHAHLRIASLDSFKVGAMDQIQKIADVLSVPCECVRDAQELQSYARKGARPEVLLIDTTGKNPKELEDDDEMREALSTVKKRNEVFLVVDANAGGKNVEFTLGSFSVYGYAAVIITKIDEAQSIGPALSACAKYKAPVLYFGYGQEPCKGFARAGMKTMKSFLRAPRLSDKNQTAEADEAFPRQADFFATKHSGRRAVVRTARRSARIQ